MISEVTELEINKLIRQMKNKMSFGTDEIPAVLIKLCANELVQPLRLLINQSLSDGVFPDLLKNAKIIPVLKPRGLETDPSQYRPIALLPTISKLFEKAMVNRVYHFFEKYGILHKNQFGFRKNHSTVLAVYHYIQEILSHIDCKKYATGLLLDMSKAYDHISHDILLRKLYGMGIRGNAYRWFQTYLQNRQQCVQINWYNKNSGETKTLTSKMRQITCSIPQGSVTGCLLFLAYINDLPKIVNTKCVMFADDVSILISSGSSTECNDRLSEVSKTVCEWLKNHNLEINLNKTKIIQFKPTQKAALEMILQINNTIIEEVTEFKLLGITIDTSINWKYHIQSVKNKLSSFIYALSVLKVNTNQKTALSAYFAFAHAWLQYGVILWGASTDVHQLLIQQKKCIRILTNTRVPDSCRPHFIKLKILTLPSIYILEAALFVRKHMNLFKQKVIKSQRRNKTNQLELPTSTLAMFRNGPYYRCILIANKIPEKIKNETKDELFKRKFKDLLIKRCYYSIDEFLNDTTLSN
jgi:hypothetical protein